MSRLSGSRRRPVLEAHADTCANETDATSSRKRHAARRSLFIVFDGYRDVVSFSLPQ